MRSRSRRLYDRWMAFALITRRVSAAVLFGVVYLTAGAIVGMIVRTRRRRDAAAPTYWRDRTRPAPDLSFYRRTS